MLRAVVRVIALGILVAPANAADLPKLSASSPEISTVMSWGGLYAGVNLGAGVGRFQWGSTPTFAGLVAGGTTVPTYTTTPFSTALTSVNLIGGGQIGYQWRLNKSTFGFEADFQRTGIKTGRFAPLNPLPPNTSAFATTGATTDLLSATVNYSASLRARFGYSVQERLLIYATGGVALGNVTADGSYLNRGGIGSSAAFYIHATNLRGWTVGLGADYSLDELWILGGEYRYTDYSHGSLQLGSLTNSPSGRIWVINNSISLATSAAVLKLNRKF